MVIGDDCSDGFEGLPANDGIIMIGAVDHKEVNIAHLLLGGIT